MSRVELFEAIRRDHRLENLSIRALAERHGVHRRTVRQALAAAAPPVRKPRVFAAPKLDPAKPLIDAMLREDLTAHRKQQHTARRVLARLGDEHQMGEVSYASVRDYVARRRPQIQAEAGRTTEQAFVPLDRRGAELLFQVLTEREETNSVAIASNESFSGWTKTFTDPRLCAAIVDRLTFGGNIIETGTTSYRLAHARTQRAEQLTRE